ncbi:MAG: hypothetical protein ACLFR0_02680 [Alphaproteobacteria bacterium]
MSEINTPQNFKESFFIASTTNDGPVTYSHIFKAMEAGNDGYASPDFVREQIQAGINDGSIAVQYGVLNEQGAIESTFSGLRNEPDLNAGERVEPVYTPV